MQTLSGEQYFNHLCKGFNSPVYSFTTDTGFPMLGASCMFLHRDLIGSLRSFLFRTKTHLVPSPLNLKQNLGLLRSQWNQRTKHCQKGKSQKRERRLNRIMTLILAYQGHQNRTYLSSKWPRNSRNEKACLPSS